jgi:DNA-binding MarR family transcriptional regulator
MSLSPSEQTALWRQTHLGHWLRLAEQRFDARVMALMAQHPGVALGLANLAARGQVGAALLHITRHLDEDGMRLTTLARHAGMSKQAMGTLVSQCEAWDLVRREADPADARARRVAFTATGRAWLGAYRDAVTQTEAEMRATLGDAVATVISLGLEAYATEAG